MEDLDNTLIFYIWGDNGASMEGTITGSFNELTFLNGVVLDAEQQLQLILKPATHQDEQALHEHAQVQAIGHGAAG
jgi:hypothetical protein